MKDLKTYIIESTSNIPKNIKDAIISGMKRGYIVDEKSKTKYGVSRENIGKLTDSVISSEQLQKLISDLEEEYGYSFKYEKDSEFEKDGYKNPDDE